MAAAKPKPPTAAEVAIAAKEWAEAKRIAKPAEAKLKAAGEVLKRHFRAKKVGEYKGLVGYSCTPTTLADMDKIWAELGERRAEFEKPGQRETLSLLKP